MIEYDKIVESNLRKDFKIYGLDMMGFDSIQDIQQGTVVLKYDNQQVYYNKKYGAKMVSNSNSDRNMSGDIVYSTSSTESTFTTLIAQDITFKMPVIASLAEIEIVFNVLSNSYSDDKYKYSFIFYSNSDVNYLRGMKILDVQATLMFEFGCDQGIDELVERINLNFNNKEYINIGD